MPAVVVGFGPGVPAVVVGFGPGVPAVVVGSEPPDGRAAMLVAASGSPEVFVVQAVQEGIARP